MRDLFKPHKIREIVFSNKFFLSPMSMFCAEKDGRITPFHRNHYCQYVNSGLGGIIIEATAISEQGRITLSDLGMYTQSQLANFKSFVTSFKRLSRSKIGIQLAHAGSKASMKVPTKPGRPFEKLHKSEGWQALSINQESEKEILSELKIQELLNQYKNSSEMADKAGFDFIEIHMGHGYLLHQILKAQLKRRKDKPANHQFNLSIPLRVFTAVRNSFSKYKPIFIRLSHGYSNNIAEDIKLNKVLAKELKRRNCDMIDLTAGGLNNTEELLSSATKMRNISPKLMMNGNFNSVQSFLNFYNANINFFSLGRALLRNPKYLYRLEKELNFPYSGPRQYARAYSNDRSKDYQYKNES